MQSRFLSFVEATVNTVVGFGVALLTGEITYNYYHLPVSPRQNAEITVIFTLVSLARSYIFRRLFNGMSVWRDTTNSDTRRAP